jgi:hypothetical protein
MRIIAENIDNYDGTGLNQRDIPRWLDGLRRNKRNWNMGVIL